MRAAIIAFIVLAGGVVAGTARAAQLGIYAGISYAMAEKDSDRGAFEDEAQAIYNAFGFAPQTTTGSFDTKDSSYGFVVGWRLTEHIALEGGYMDLGEVVYRDRARACSTTCRPRKTGRRTSNPRPAASRCRRWAYCRSAIAGKSMRAAGVLIATNTESVFITDGVGSESLRASKSGADLLAGVGVSFSIVEIYSLRLEYQRVFDAGEDDTLDEADVDMATLNITVSF